MKKSFFSVLLIALIFTNTLEGMITVAAEGIVPIELRTEYVPDISEKNPNIIINPYSIQGYSTCGANKEAYTYARAEEGVNDIIFTRQSDKEKETFWDPFGMALGKDKITAMLNPEKDYVVSLWLKNANPEIETVDFAIGAGYNSAYGDRAKWTVANTEWQEFKGIINAKRENIQDIGIGIAKDYIQDGGTVILGASKEHYTYIAEEQPWEIKAEVTEVMTEPVMTEGGNLKAKASVLNQIGSEYGGDMGHFDWYAVNERKNRFIDGITIITDETTQNAEITVNETVEAGTYYIAVYSEKLSGTKFIPLEISPAVEKTAEKPQNMIADSKSYFGYGACGAGAEKYTNVQAVNGKRDIRFTRQADKEKESFWDPFGVSLGNGKISPIPEKGKNYVVSMWLKNANPDVESVDFAIRSGYNRNYGSAIQWNVKDTDWQEYKGILNPERTIELALGIPAEYTIDRGSVILGASEDYYTYIAEEIPYSVGAKVSGGNTLIHAGKGGSFTVETDVLNQIGLQFSGDKGEFDLYPVTDECNAFLSGVSIDFDGGTDRATINVDENVPVGDYKILIKSKKYNLCSTVKFVVTELKDYVPGAKPENMIVNPTKRGTYTWLGGSYTSQAVEDDNTNEAKVIISRDQNKDISTFWNPDGCEVKNRTKDFESEKNYVVSARVKKVLPKDDENVMFACGIGLYGSGNTKIAEQSISADGFNKYRQVIRLGKNANVNRLKFGVPESEKKDNVQVELDLSSGYEPYVAEEVLYDITNNVIEGSNVVTYGQGGAFTAKAELVNQIGLKMDCVQSFTWLVTDEAGNILENDISIKEHGDTAEINIGETVPCGIYKVIAISNEYKNFCRSLTVYVTNNREEISIYVSPNGNDLNSGTEEKPLKTIEAAQKRVSQLAAVGASCTVELCGGEYRMEKPVFLGEEDSGTKERPVVYKSKDGEQAIIKGSVSLNTNSAKPVTDESVLERLHPKAKEKVLEINLAEQGIRKEDIFNPEEAAFNGMALYKNGEYNCLYIDSAEQELAHWPNGRHYARFKGWETDYDNDRTNDSWSNGTSDKFYYADAETAPSRWVNAKNWWVAAFPKNDHAFGRMMVQNIDTAQKSIKLAQNVFATSGYHGLNVNRWQAYNLLEEMDIPGEFYIDREKMKLYFYPPYDIENAKLELSLMSQPIIQIREAHDITFKNIVFTQSRYHAIEMVDVDNVDFVGCTFKYISGIGINVSGSSSAETQKSFWQRSRLDGSYNTDIRDCKFYKIGSAAIDINGGNVDTLTPSNNIIENNIFERTAQRHFLYAEAIVLRGVGHTVRNNEFGGIPSQAIQIWGNDHVVECNEFYDVIQEVTDAGAIYRVNNEIARNALVKYNYFHDFDITDDFDKHAENLLSPVYRIGVYWDGFQQGCITEKNIFKNIAMDIHSTGTSAQIYRYNTSVNVARPVRFTPTLYEEGNVQNCIYNTRDSNLTINDLVNDIYDKDLYYKRYPELKAWIEDGVNPLTFTKVSENLVIGNLLPASFSDATLRYGQIEMPVSAESCDDFVNPEKQDYRLKSGSTTALAMPELLNEDNFTDINVIGVNNGITYNNETSPFKLLYPANGQTVYVNDDIEFVWQEAEGATKYRLVVSDNPTLDNPIIDKTTEFNTQTVKSGMFKKNITYYWKVYASNPSRNHKSEWTNAGGAYSFNTGSLKTELSALKKTGGAIHIDAAVENVNGGYDDNSDIYIAFYDKNDKLENVQKFLKEKSKSLSIAKDIFMENSNDIEYAQMFVWHHNISPQTTKCVTKILSSS